jgi:RNA polymerase sigma-70 factor (ECF subfamily)
MGDPVGNLDFATSFESLYNAQYREISGYVRRRVPECDAPDVIAQVFAVAWRRFEHVPSPPEDRLWLFGVARHGVADYRRAGSRRRRLHARLSQEAPSISLSVNSLDPLHARVAAAIDKLRPKDREVIQLVLWDDLTHAEAAVVIGCSVNAVELRLRRAQARVRDWLAKNPSIVEPPGLPLGATRQWRSEP